VSIRLFSTALVDAFCSSQARVEWVYHFFLRWPSVVRPGDVLTVETEIVDLRPSRSRPGYGIIRLRNVTTNQRGEIVQTMPASAMVRMRKL
jgi:acyl dehydratase